MKLRKKARKVKMVKLYNSPEYGCDTCCVGTGS